VANDELGADADDPPGPDLAWIEAVREVYDGVSAPLWRSLVASFGSTDVADDAVAEGFAQLLRRGRVVREPAAWVWRASFRLASGEAQRRRRAAQRSVDSAGFDDATAELAGSLDRLPDDAIDLVNALRTLSDQQRRCVALVDIAGHTAPAAAAILGTSPATVRVQLMRARHHLRSLLADRAPALSAPNPASTAPEGQPGPKPIRRSR
jgi:RNA polymerase sigma-70 factor (ECF subfamily)